MADTDRWMAGALEEAGKGLGDTSPNPAVGALIVHGGRVIARGYHRAFGGLHAEIEALNCVPEALRKKFRLMTLVVTLEPCNHFGKTPPCTDAIIRAGIGRVIVGMLDPHDIVAGRGVRKLRRAGVRIEVQNNAGVRAFYEPYVMFHRNRRPLVTLKLAVSADAKIAGKKQGWITGPAARAEVQRIRRRVDAIIVGRKTAEIDNPHLTVRPPFRKNRRRSPLRAILTAGGKLSPKLRLFHDAAAPTLIITTKNGRRRLSRRAPAASVLTVPAQAGGVSLRAALVALARRGIMHVLVEGGAETANRFLDDGLVDELILFISPKIIGAGVDAFRPRHAQRTVGRRRGAWRLTAKRSFGRDLMLVFRKAGE